MAVIINTNMDSIKIQNCLTTATNKMSTAMQRMSTGLKINQAKDDAAGCQIAARMDVQLSGNQIAQNNVQSGNALLSTAEGNIDVVLENVSRIRDLTLQAKNGTYSTEEKEAMQTEVQQRIDEVNRISNSAEYSDIKLFENTTAQTNGITFQVGADSGSDYTITADKSIFGSVKFSTLCGNISNFNISTATADQLNTYLTNLDTAVDNVTERKSTIGATENRLDSALSTLTTQYTNLSASKSVITDADIAEEASEYTNQSILQQVSTSLLSQANQNPSIALSLV